MMTEKQALIEKFNAQFRGIEIDPEVYPNRESEGLEGPFAFWSGRILYYDRIEGCYYDSRSDIYLDRTEAP